MFRSILLALRHFAHALTWPAGRSESLATPSGPTLPWGGCDIADRPPLLAASFAVLGAPGAGKSLLVRMLMRAALAPRDGVPRHRAIVLDEKRNAYPILRGQGIAEDRIKLFQPFDGRLEVSVAWDMAKDLKEPAAARQAATNLLPLEKGTTQPFFVNAAQDLLTGVFMALNATKPGSWILLDVVRAMKSPEKLRALLRTTPDGRDLLATYIDHDSRVAANILATGRTKLAPFETVAALWSRATKKVSLVDWATTKDPYVIVLGTDDASAATLRPLMQAVFQRAAELITGRVEEEPPDQSFFFLDEVRVAGRLRGLDSLLLKGRSKSARVVLAAQDVEGLMSVYGDKEARELLGMCGNVALLRQFGTGSMEWASKLLGKHERKRATHTTNRDKFGQPNGDSTAIGTDMADVMSPREFRELPLATRECGIFGVFGTPVRFWQGAIEPAFIERHLLPLSQDVGFDPRDAEDQLPPVPVEEPILPFEDALAGIDLAELTRTTEARETVPPENGRVHRTLRTMDDHDDGEKS